MEQRRGKDKQGKKTKYSSLILRLSLYALLLASLALGVLFLWIREYQASRGVVYGPPPAVSQAAVPRPLGVNVDFCRYDPANWEQALTAIKEGGFGWVRQRFPWAEIEPQPGEYDWDLWDDIVAAIQRQDLALIALLDTSPSWARKEEDANNPLAPPEDPVAYGRFVHAFAQHYGEIIGYYQIWDEPNIYPHWGNRYIDPAGYVALLREGYIEIKTVDPTAFVLTAGLAPTTEKGPLNLSEPLFLEGMYAAGASDYFDILAAKPYGFWSGPEDRRVDPAILNFSRIILLRETMVHNGDGHKAIWAVEFGWNALPAPWSGSPSPWGTDEEAKQARRTIDAIQRARDEWPWLGVMALAEFQPSEGSNDPHQGFALVSYEGKPRTLYQRIQELTSARSLAHVGRYAADHYTAQYRGQWRVTHLGADIGRSGDSLLIPFKGTRLDLTLRRGDFWGVLYVTIDGEATNRLPQDGEGRSYLILRDPLRRIETITLASGLADAEHEARLVAEGGWGQWAIVGWTVIREKNLLIYHLAILLLALAGLFLAWHPLRLFFPPGSQVSSWLTWLGRVEAAYHNLREGPQLAITVLVAAIFYFSPWPPLTFLSLALLALVIYLRLELGLTLAAFTIPFFLQTKDLMGKRFSMVEIVTLLCLAAWILRELTARRTQGFWTKIRYPSSGIRHQGTRIKDRASGIWDQVSGIWHRVFDLSRSQNSFVVSALALSKRAKARTTNQNCYVLSLRFRLSTLDWAVLSFVAVSVLSLSVAENVGVAKRELRVVVLDPAFFYFLLRAIPLKERDLQRIAEALILSALGVSLIGLYQYAFTAAFIFTEGVYRVHSVYASPNNLGLFLGRIVPILASLVFLDRSPLRRAFHGLISLPILVCLYLTYSRGAWLLGLPAALLFIGLVRGGRAIWAALGASLAAIGGLLLPLVGTERMASTFKTQEGTAFLRLKLWEGSLNMIQDHPLLGVGLDNFLYQYRTRYILPEAWKEADLSHPHNIVLDYWTRLGVLGVAAIAWLEIAFFRKGLSHYHRLPDGLERALILGFMASMVDFLAHGLIDNSYFLVDLAFVFFLTVGVVAKAQERHELGPTQFLPVKNLSHPQLNDHGGARRKSRIKRSGCMQLLGQVCLSAEEAAAFACICKGE